MWAQYIVKRGSLNTARNLEYGFSLLAMLVNNAAFMDKKTQKDFMPHYHEQEISLETAIKTWE